MLTRHRVAELMDDINLPRGIHFEALEGIQRLNAVSFAESLIWSSIFERAKSSSVKTFSLLDIATGGGDIPIKLSKLAKKFDISLEIEACDISEQALEVARERAKRTNCKISFFQACALSSDFKRSYDFVTTSLFTHHLDPENVISLMRRMKTISNQLVLIDDLSRSSINYWLIFLASRIFSRSKVVHFDGPASVQAAYTPSEMLDLAFQANLKDARVKHHFPCRFLLEASSH